MMTKRVTVTVPDEIHKKMEKWKKKFNYSGIFQEAVSREILKRETFESKVQEDKTLAEIWRQADFDKPDADFETGREMGFVYAKTAPYSEIKSLEQYIPAWDKKDQERIRQLHYDLDIWSILSNSGILKDAPVKVTPKKRISKRSLKGAAKSFSWNAFDLGFLTGVMEFLKEEVDVVETSLLVAERDKEIRKAKTKRGKRKIYASSRSKIIEKVYPEELKRMKKKEKVA